MDKVSYSIINRGKLEILYKGRSYGVTGELTISPPVFYADINCLEVGVDLSQEDIDLIVRFLESDSVVRIGTKIVFD